MTTDEPTSPDLATAASDLLNQLTLLRMPDESRLWQLGGSSLEAAYQALRQAVDARHHAIAPHDAESADALLIELAAMRVELNAARAVVAAVRRWTQHPTSALPIDAADMRVIGAILDALASYDAARSAADHGDPPF